MMSFDHQKQLFRRHSATDTLISFRYVAESNFFNQATTSYDYFSGLGYSLLTKVQAA